MDIEKVIENLRYSVENSERHVQAVRNSDTDHPFAVIPLALPEARALLTEIDYWRARCEKAEKFISESPCDPDVTKGQIWANDSWQAAVAGESDKAPYLETLQDAKILEVKGLCFSMFELKQPVDTATSITVDLETIKPFPVE